jgi:ribosomal protein S18 acetylase RimI-like enzyme
VPIAYTTDLAGVRPAHLHGFFEGWPHPPTPESHLQILQGSFRVVLAREQGKPQVIGFVNALSDGVLSAFVPLLEVLPTYRGHGIGTELVRRMLDELDGLYSVDVVCDEELRPFYARFDMEPLLAMALRRR